MKHLKLIVALLAVASIAFCVSCKVEIHNKHEFDDWAWKTEPTLNAAGVAKRSCKCGKTEDKDVPALSDADVWSVKETIAATHLKEGSVIYTSEYGDVKVTLEKLAEHEYGDWTITTAPTYEGMGAAERVCPCGAKDTIDVPALNNSEVWSSDMTVIPKLSEEGRMVYTSEYGNVENAVPALNDHDVWAVNLTANPTLSEEGRAGFTSGYGEVEAAIPALSNENIWSVKAKTDPTHLAEGSATYESGYGEVTIELPKKPEHEFGAWKILTEPTLEAAGTAKRECPCGAVENGAVPALSNENIWSVKAKTDPTHLAEGSATYSSNEYGEVTIVLPKNPEHEFGAWEITAAPTLEAAGSAKRTCECGAEETGVVPALSDESIWSVKAKTDPTHLAEGSATYSSNEYGEVTIVLPKKPEHEFGAWEITAAPTLEEKGIAKRVCSCGEEETGEVPALSDESVWTLSEEIKSTHFVAGSATYVSNAYGTVTIELPLDPEHVFGNWELITAPTLEEAGTAKRSCECGEEETGEVPALSDESVWTEVKRTEPTHYDVGSATYSSEAYGEVTIELPKKPEHEFGAWEVLTEPTLENEGTARRECPCGAVENGAVPALNDESVWTLNEKIEPTNEEHGSATYVSDDYGAVTIILSRFPFGQKTYAAYQINARGSGDRVWANDRLTANTIRGTFTTDAEGIGFVMPIVKGENGVDIDPDYGFVNKVPYEGWNEFHMIDFATGAINYTAYDVKTEITEDDYYGYSGVFVRDADGNFTKKEPAKEDLKGFVDPETGIVICAINEAFTFVRIYTPFETAPAAGNISASSWNGCLAIEYFINGNSYRAFLCDGVVHFGVTFTNFTGEEVRGEDCYMADVLYVRASNGDLINCYAMKDGELTVSDGLTGVYITPSNNVLKLNGAGLAMLDDNEGWYAVAEEGANYDVELYVYPEYFEVCLDGTHCTMVKPMVTLSFETFGKAALEPVEVNKNIPPRLPFAETEDLILDYWYLDEELNNPIPDDFAPTEDMTLYAKWADKVELHIIDPHMGNEDVVVPAGHTVGEIFPHYGIDEPALKKFEGWFLDAAFSEPIGEDMVIEREEEPIDIYAKWVDLPVYYGTYYGPEFWGCNYGGGDYCARYELSFDADGNVSSEKLSGMKGIVYDYDPETQVIRFKENETATSYRYLWFDRESGIIIANYNKPYADYIANDFYVFGKEVMPEAHYAVKTDKDGTQDFRLQFISLEDYYGEECSVFVYNDRIYSEYGIANAAGDPMRIEDIKDSATLVVTVGEERIALAAKGGTFGTGSETEFLDKYFGTYIRSSDGKPVVLDGLGGIRVDGVPGTYIPVEGAAYGFDVYLNNETEYYELTLDGNLCDMVKPVVVLTLYYGNGMSTVQKNVNAKVEYKLPELIGEDMLFKGWYLDDQYENAVPYKFRPEEDMSVYALWMEPVTVTVHRNDGSDPEVIPELGKGESFGLEEPVYARHIFKGWFTAEAFEEGSEWANGSIIEGDLDIYAKWEEAPAYNRDYIGAVMKYGDNGVVTPDSRNFILSVDANGVGYKKAYPFNEKDGIYEISIVNADTGEILVKVYAAQTEEVENPDYDPTDPDNPYNTETIIQKLTDENGNFIKNPEDFDSFKGYIDKATGLIMREKGAGTLMLMTPLHGKEVKAEDVSASAFAGALAVDYCADGEHHLMFYDGIRTYFNVTFTDADGNAVAGNACHNAAHVEIKDAEGNLIATYENGVALV